MTGDPIELLRDADPVKDGGNARDFEDVRAWIQREQARPGSSRRISRARWLHGLAPALGVAVTAGVLAVVVIAVGAHHSARHAQPTVTGASPSARIPSPASLLPARGGMRGLVFALTVAGSRSTLRVSFTQCTNCGDSTPPDAREVNWSSTSTDGGRTWRTERARLSLVAFTPSPPEGRNVWESGYTPHAGDPTFFVSHDGGRSYGPVRAPADSGFDPITLGAGEAWTLGVRCVHYRCDSSVLHGPAAGSMLSRTATQPPGMPTRRAPTLLLVAGYGDTAFVSEGGQRRVYVTRDDGHSWTRASFPCSVGTAIEDLTSYRDAVWVTCAPRPHGDHERASAAVTVRRSLDSGRHWQTPGPAFHGPARLVAVSPQVIWAARSNGALDRSTNEGRSWRRVLGSIGAELSVEIDSATTATVATPITGGRLAAHTRRTDLVAYRTVDGGAHWTHQVIRLPAG